MVDDFIASNTAADNAPDRFERKKLGGVDCHYALAANHYPTLQPNEAKSMPQQDRASAFALPGAVPTDFKKLMQQSFDAMKQAFDNRSNHEGSACATVTLFDPRSGKLAIGSKGDTAVYVALRHKQKPDRVFCSRVSSPYEYYEKKQEAKGDGPDRIAVYPNSLLSSTPVMYAQEDSWKQQETLSFIRHGLMAKFRGAPDCKLIDLPDVAQRLLADIKKDNPAMKNDALGDYSVSLIASSDGLSAGSDNMPKNHPDRVAADDAMAANLAGNKALQSVAPDSANIAQGLAEFTMGKNTPGRDNISALVLSNITFGQGEPVALCVVDGASARTGHKSSEAGAVAAQVVIDAFEQVMHKARGQSASHADSIVRAQSKRQL